MTSDQTQLTVLMAVYNGSPFLRVAIDSILNQTYSDFCFMIVDDASTDDTREIVRSYDDPRIKLICLEKNSGQTAALNVGLHQATTPWIARMDADDFSAPTRFEEQMKALENDPSISCLGSFAWIFQDDPHESFGVVGKFLRHDEIVQDISAPPIIHGTLVVKREALLDVGSYNDRYWFLADVDLYDRLLPNYVAANIPEQLLGIRRHPGQASLSKRAADEGIEIATNRLSTNNYSHAQASIVRTNLSRAYFYRARCAGGERDVTGLIKNLLGAFRTSPKIFMWYFFVVFGVYSISPRLRSRLKDICLRIFPPARAWW